MVNTPVLNDLIEKLPITISRLISAIEGKMSLKWPLLKETEKEDIEREIKDCCNEFFYGFQEMPYDIIQEYRNNYIKEGSDISDRYSKRVQWLFTDNIVPLNELMASIDEDYKSKLKECEDNADEYDFLFHDPIDLWSLAHIALQINGMYFYLRDNLKCATAPLPITRHEEREINEIHSNSILEIFSSSDCFSSCIELLKEIQVIDNTGKCILTQRTGYLLFACIHAMKYESRKRDYFAKQYSDLNLLSAFNTYLGTTYIKFKKEGKGYLSTLPEAIKIINR